MKISGFVGGGGGVIASCVLGAGVGPRLRPGLGSRAGGFGIGAGFSRNLSQSRGRVRV